MIFFFGNPTHLLLLGQLLLLFVVTRFFSIRHLKGCVSRGFLLAARFRSSSSIGRTWRRADLMVLAKFLCLHSNRVDKRRTAKTFVIVSPCRSQTNVRLGSQLLKVRPSVWLCWTVEKGGWRTRWPRAGLTWSGFGQGHRQKEREEEKKKQRRPSQIDINMCMCVWLLCDRVLLDCGPEPVQSSQRAKEHAWSWKNSCLSISLW